jgi:hypothetical protein
MKEIIAIVAAITLTLTLDAVEWFVILTYPLPRKSP